jgi:hypothetical protein
MVSAAEPRPFAIHRVSWGAVLAGVALALVVHLMLNMLGAGVGIATLDPGTGDNPSAGNFTIGAGIWFVVSGIIAAFAGGWLASRAAAKPLRVTGGLHGLTSWAVTTLIVVFVLSSIAGGIMAGAFQGVTGMARTAVSTTADRNLSTDDVARAAGVTPGELRDAARDANTNAAQIADTATAAVSTSLIVSVVALVLGALAAWFGGVAGTIKAVTVTTETVVRRNI